MKEGKKSVECNDKRCPVHGSISIRGAVFTGAVVSAKPDKTVVVERPIVQYVPKYERYKKTKSKVYAHNPSCINAKEHDIVKVGETRRLSKTKSFVVMEIVGKKKAVEAEEEAAERKRRKKEEQESEREKREAETEDKQEEAENEEEEKNVEEEEETEAGAEEGKEQEEEAESGEKEEETEAEEEAENEEEEENIEAGEEQGETEGE